MEGLARDLSLVEALVEPSSTDVPNMLSAVGDGPEASEELSIGVL